MYKCLDCEHVFEDDEKATVFETLPGDIQTSELFFVCPKCGGDFEETRRCQKCLGEFLEDELIGGCYCEECLRDMLTFENFLEFATSGNGVDILEDFVFTKIFGLSDVPSESSPSLKIWCRIIYNHINQNIAMKIVEKYMDEFPTLWDDFAEYLYGKEVKK